MVAGRRGDRRRPHGSLGLVTSAAILDVGSVLDATPAIVERAMKVNVLGTVLAFQAVLPRMIAAGGGAIVAVASVNATLAEQQLGIYNASKSAVRQLARTVAMDHARSGVRVNVLSPGPMLAGLFKRHLEFGQRRRQVPRHPLRPPARRPHPRGARSCPGRPLPALRRRQRAPRRGRGGGRRPDHELRLPDRRRRRLGLTHKFTGGNPNGHRTARQDRAHHRRRQWHRPLGRHRLRPRGRPPRAPRH